MNDRNLHVLVSPGFVVSLLLLVLNDFVFKAQFHNHVTGKLSDFAGLFAFSLFWAAFFPHRKTFICVSSAVLFAFWKSAHSQTVIDGWNSLPLFEIGRTVDYGDLWALLVLPLSYFYVDIRPKTYAPRTLIYLIAIVSAFAFTATSFSQEYSYNNGYEFNASKKQLLEQISRFPTAPVDDSFWDGNEFRITFDHCTDEAMVTIAENEDQTFIVLKRMHNRCPTKRTEDELREFFEKEFIQRLREGSGASTQVTSIRAVSP
ncbi:MAG TPA: hypothetical protein VFZ22_00940 [Pyrinomonadaceae bacterium]|nr:hypothetical protein [Pyrinomonadaceae bacterium]